MHTRRPILQDSRCTRRRFEKRYARASLRPIMEKQPPRSPEYVQQQHALLPAVLQPPADGTRLGGPGPACRYGHPPVAPRCPSAVDIRPLSTHDVDNTLSKLKGKDV
uniref:Uncharacterized protein n=1 Tax=Panagrellus redivivus TaxID=6233 RepID=A0A7E4VFY1_PANRE